MTRTEQSIVMDALGTPVSAYFIDPAHLTEYFMSMDAVKDIQRLLGGRYTFTDLAHLQRVP